MCAVHGCSNVPTRKVTVVANTVVGERTETVEVCDEHWSALNNTGVGFSMGCAPTVNQGNGEQLRTTAPCCSVEDSHIPEAGTSA